MLPISVSTIRDAPRYPNSEDDVVEARKAYPFKVDRLAWLADRLETVRIDSRTRNVRRLVIIKTGRRRQWSDDESLRL